LLSKISEKYKLHLENYISIDYLRLVKEILSKYDPVNVTSASSLLASYTGREIELLKTLGGKFKTNFNDLIISIYTSGLLLQSPIKENYPTLTEYSNTVFQENKIHPNTNTTVNSLKNLMIGIISASVIILTVLILYFSGVFNPGKKVNKIVPNNASSGNLNEIRNSNEQVNASKTSPSIPDNKSQPNANQKVNQHNTGYFYIISAAAVKTENQAKAKATELRKNSNSTGYLWIPDYASLSGAQYYCVYIGPFYTQHACEVATEEYRKLHPEAYGLLVSQERKRVQINGISKVVVTQK